MIPLEYTGLKDKNDKEIYEGDVVKTSEGENCEVIFERGEFCIHSSIEKPKWDNGVEVIGNIYENPELLTKWNNMIDKKHKPKPVK